MPPPPQHARRSVEGLIAKPCASPLPAAHTLLSVYLALHIMRAPGMRRGRGQKRDSFSEGTLGSGACSACGPRVSMVVCVLCCTADTWGGGALRAQQAIMAGS